MPLTCRDDLSSLQESIRKSCANILLDQFFSVFNIHDYNTAGNQQLFLFCQS